MSFEEQWKLLKPVWRILVVVLMFQLLGSVVYVLNDVKGVPFLNLWYGGAYATPIGFIIGLLWHVKAVENGLLENKLVILFLGLLSLALPVFGYLTRNTWVANYAS